MFEFKLQSVDLNTEGKFDSKRVEKEKVQRNLRALFELQEGHLKKHTVFELKALVFSVSFL